jgi:error-prone DNA polymerase
VRALGSWKPSMTDYAELHAHSAYSFLDGASQPEELVAEAVRLGLTGLALTDHDGLYGAVRFANAAREAGLPTVFGAELHLATQTGVLDPPTGLPDPRSTHLVVLARGPDGYRRLSAAIGAGHLATGQKGAAHYQLTELAERAEGHWLILTGCRKGAVRTALADPRTGTSNLSAARAELDRLVALFGADNVVVEITDDATAQSGPRNAALAELASATHLPLVATGNVHYATPADADLADALAAIRARATLDEMDGWLPGTGGAHLRSADEMLRRHPRYPQAVATAAALAAECAFDLQLVAPNLPPFPVPVGYNEASWLRELVRRGALGRYGPPDAERVPGAYAQLAHELDVIETLGFPGYFLVVHDLAEFCRTKGILAQGRGSAANSAVCYALGITAVDAVAHGLLFERFLAPERDGPPDIDLDIESVRREEVIQYVYNKHGREHAAQVANVVSYRPRSAVRDAARVLGYSPGQQDAWSKSIDRWGSIRGDGPGVARDVPGDARDGPGVARDVPMASWNGAGVARDGPTEAPTAAEDLAGIPDEVIALAERLLRLPRHLGVHPGGMVICDRPVIEVCPVEWARMPGRTVLQWDKDDCADAGLVKFDLLGLGMLTALRIAFDLVEQHEGIRLGLHELPADDPAVYDLLCAADTVGVFQVESRAQMATLPRLQPRCFYDIVVQVALIRPGPIQGGSVHPFINRLRGREPVTYLHPRLKKSLERTLGVPLFQEQLMQMAVDVADFTPAEADQLRRAMGSKRSLEKMTAMHARFTAGTAANGISFEVSEQIFDKLRGFADFGFPESHAYSFAYLVYASAWLKAHHPAAFYAGLLAAQPMGFYSTQSLVEDARRHGIRVLRPCVQRSAAKATVERLAVSSREGEGAIADLRSGAATDLGSGAATDLKPGELAVRLGLDTVRGIGPELAEAIVTERDRSGLYEGLPDLVRRVELTTAQLEVLATADALAGFGITRREGLWAAGVLGQEGPTTLPGVSVGAVAPPLPEMSPVEEAVADVWATGVSPDTYPTQFVRSSLAAAGVLTVAETTVTPARRRVACAGVVTHRQRPGTARGVTFLSLEDETGLLNVVVSPGVWRRFRQVARSSAALVIRGMVERGDGAVNLVAEHITPLSLRVPSKSRDFR